MYIVLLSVMLVLGTSLFVVGHRRHERKFSMAGIGCLAATLGLFGLLSFWGEMLWFQELGFERRFWTRVLAQLGVALAGALVAGSLAWALTFPVRRSRRERWIGVAAAAVVGLVWGMATWSVALRWALGVATSTVDPVLGMNTGFYLFALPFYDALYWLLLLASGIALLTGAWTKVPRRAPAPVIALPSPASRLPDGLGETRSPGELELELEGPPHVPNARVDEVTLKYRGLFVPLAAVALVLGLGRLLGPYHLMYSDHGTLHGAGWTDVHVRLPAYYVTAFALLLAGAVWLVPRATRFFARPLSHSRFASSSGALATSVVGSVAGFAALVWVIGLAILPALFRWLYVQPNELAVERTYIENNIAFTRKGFNLDHVEIREFPVDDELTYEIAQDNDRLLSEVRLWDPRALDDVLHQFQELRLYYEITGVDFDRYHLDGRYRQVMVAPREMMTKNLPIQSQTFVNRHFKYTHGYGLVMAPVSDFTPTGLPRLILRDLPPIAEYPVLRIDRPGIYYGELTDDYVVANTRAAEFDYPQGGSNVYTHYDGSGGIPLNSFWRKLVFGWKVGGTRLLVSEYPHSDSRILLRRNIAERVKTVAPFLELDHDPYTVVVDGRVKWIVDAYTASTYYPYSEPYLADRPSIGVPSRSRATGPERAVVMDAREGGKRLHRANYLRNSVKAVVDAFDGTVSLYIFDPSDPVIQVWSRIYPDLLRPMTDMAPELRAHVRYPEAMLHVQGSMFSKYHMTDPIVFYNQEDLWVRATEKYYDETRAVEPYYVMWQAPGSSEVEFILMQPYTPKSRQVMIGWIAGLCDGENYGKMVAYRFPKDRWVLGPQQVDTKIDQSPELSAQLTLWDQHGKRVIRGNVLAIPIARTILYVEPIYIQAETAAYPELRMVVLMHGDDMSYASTFEEALDGLLRGAPAAVLPDILTSAEAAREASRAFEEYLKLTSDGRLEAAGKQLELVRDRLRQLEASGALPLPSR